MKCPVITCKKDKPTIEKLASHISHMALNSHEIQHDSWLAKYKIPPYAIDEICDALKKELGI